MKEDIRALQGISKLYTIDELRHRPENRSRHFELLHGKIIEKAMPTEEHGIIIHTLSCEIYIFLKCLR